MINDAIKASRATYISFVESTSIGDPERKELIQMETVSRWLAPMWRCGLWKMVPTMSTGQFLAKMKLLNDIDGLY
jgi:hypothetical protein